MALYKLTKGTLSIIRTSREAVDAEISNGFKLDGKVNENYEVVDSKPFEEPRKKTEPKQPRAKE